MLYVHNGYFRICGDSTVVSLVNGGPPPCFFEENVCKMLCDPNSVDLQNVCMKEHLTSKEVVGTVLVSLVTKRLTYLKEFYTCLELLGTGLILKSNSELLKPVFVGQVEEVDANIFLASIKATFSELGTNRRNIEEMIIDYLQDTIISLEDEEVAGETEQPAYLQTNDRDCCFSEGKIYSDVIDRVKPKMSAASVFQWLTGERHKPANVEKITVMVESDHDCLESNNNRCCSHEFKQKLQKSVFTAYCKVKYFRDVKYTYSILL